MKAFNQIPPIRIGHRLLRIDVKSNAVSWTNNILGYNNNYNEHDTESGSLIIALATEYFNMCISRERNQEDGIIKASIGDITIHKLQDIPPGVNGELKRLHELLESVIEDRSSSRANEVFNMIANLHKIYFTSHTIIKDNELPNCASSVQTPKV